jgi:hypothetical protein
MHGRRSLRRPSERPHTRSGGDRRTNAKSGGGYTGGTCGVNGVCALGAGRGVRREGRLGDGFECDERRDKSVG